MHVESDGEQTVHIITMIGDQQQLPPLVQSVNLQFNHNFGMSLMERLTKSMNTSDYAQLMFQSRMDPEISKYLIPEYPKLQDNLAIVGQREHI